MKSNGVGLQSLQAMKCSSTYRMLRLLGVQGAYASAGCRKNFRPISGQRRKKVHAKPFKQMAIPRVELMTASMRRCTQKQRLQAIDSAVLTREPLPWSGRGQNRPVQLVGRIGGPGRDRTDDLFHAME